MGVAKDEDKAHVLCEGAAEWTTNRTCTVLSARVVWLWEGQGPSIEDGRRSTGNGVDVIAVKMMVAYFLVQREDEAKFAHVVQYYTELSELGHAVEREACV